MDDNTFSLPKNSTADGSDETLNHSVFRSDAENFQTKKVVAPIESNIEITVPISVTKRKSAYGSDPVEGSRHRSSNSVSSCEMALGIGQLDGEEETFASEDANTSGENAASNTETKADGIEERKDQASMDSCSFMNDAIEYASRIMEQKQRTGSVCSFPEEYLITERVPRRKRFDSESR